MKFFAFAAAAVLCVGLAASTFLGSTGTDPAHAEQAPLAPERPLVFVPGLLGSMLCRPAADGGETVVWGTVDAMGQFPSLAVDATSNDIKACGLIREISYLGIFSQTVYGPFIDRLEQAG